VLQDSRDIPMNGETLKGRIEILPNCFVEAFHLVRGGHTATMATERGGADRV
jgi:hypothetical protein